jgi:O-methyltransferase involved in polyketide biosynthesis
VNREGQVSVELVGVPETLLWTLYHRATDARRPDAVLRDPKAVELLDRIDFPFEERFGNRRASAVAGPARRMLRSPGRALPL